MEVLPQEFSESKKEIDKLGEVYKLEPWQRERLLREVVKRRSMGYVVDILKIAKEWGWVSEEADSSNLASEVTAVQGTSNSASVSNASQQPSENEGSQSSPEVIEGSPESPALESKEAKEAIEQSSGVETLSPETESQEQQSADSTELEAAPQPQSVSASSGWENNGVVGYPLPEESSPSLNPDEIAKMTTEDSAPWLFTIVKKISAALLQ